MKSEQLDAVRSAFYLKFQKRQSVLARVIEREGELRSDLLKLDRQSRDVDKTGVSEMHSIGADVIWRAWVGRTKHALNLELAQLLAQKEILLREVRKDFGKVQICQEIARRDRNKRIKREANLALLSAIEQGFGER